MKKQFTIGNVLSESWKQFTGNFRWIMILGLILFVPLNIIFSIFYPPFDSLSWANQIGPLYIVLRVLESLLGIVAMMSIAYVIKNKIERKLINLSNIFKKVFSRFGHWILTHLMASIFLIGLYILLIIPGIIYSTYWMFVVLVVLFNNKSGKPALDYSKSLVKGRWWKVFGCMILVAMIVGFIGGGLSALVFFSLEQMHSNFFLNLIITTFAKFISTFGMVTFAVLYLTLESTKKN